MTAPPPPTGSTWLVIRSSPPPPAPRPLEEAARLVGIHPERLRHYCRLGIFGPALAGAESELVFDDDRLYELRRFEYFRRTYRVNQPTLQLLCDLWREVERLQAELRFLRVR